MASASENWSIGDFLVHFQKEVDRAQEQRFKERFKDLARALEQLDSEFMTQNKACGGRISPIIDQLHSLSGRLGYCERPRGFEKDCEILYADVEKAIRSVNDFRGNCST